MSASNANIVGAPASCGQRLLPVYVDEVARNEPKRAFAIISTDPKSYASGSRTITYATFAKAVDRFAWFVEEHFGKPSKNETLAYMGPNDLRYFAAVLGAIKAGFHLLLPSPRNSISNHINLLEKTHCSEFLKDESMEIDHIMSAYHESLHATNIPSFEALFSEGDSKPYPWNPSFEEMRDQPAVTLHSSGSTGQVKPIPMTHGSWASIDRTQMIPSKPGWEPLTDYLRGDGNNTCFISMPLFHAAGLFTGLLMNVFFHLTYVAPPPGAPMNPMTIISAMSATDPDFALCAPSMLEEMTEDPKALEVLGKLKNIIYAGGALSDYAGDIIAKHARIQSWIGTTEAGIYPVYRNENPKHDYPYIRFNPEQDDIEFRLHDEENYEMVLVRPKKSLEWSSIFHTFPDKTEYHTSDLWKKHPTKVGLWKHTGRSDDVIVLSNGEKVVPSWAESVLHQSPDLHEVIFYGSKRFQISAIIELEAPAQSVDRKEMLKRLEPYVKKANANVPGHAKLAMDHIIFTTPEKPLTRTPKGTVARNATYKNFETELDEVYSNEDGVEVSSTPLIKGSDEKTTVKELATLFARVADTPDLTEDQDFLQAGVDSLKIITLVRQIKVQLESEKADIPIRSVNSALIYSHPTLAQLAHALHNLGKSVSSETQTAQHVQAIHDMLAKYTKDLPAASSQTAPTRTENLTVVLTGSTGSLGCYLLSGLLQNPAVSKIYALNRSKDGRKVQTNAFKARGLTAPFGDRVVFERMEVGKPHLGLEQSVYEAIFASVDIILHNAWPVNFNMPLSTFEPHIAGMRHMVDLAAAAPHRPALLFTSSIGTVGNWKAIHPAEGIPEFATQDPRVTGAGGYGASKWVAERLLDAASKDSGVRAANVRVGQLAGSVVGRSVWNKWEWFPSILASSAFLGKLPADLGAMGGIDFVPLDRAAGTLLDLAYGAIQHAEGYRGLIFNMVNPHHRAFEPFVPAIVQRLSKSTGRKIDVVPYSDWVQALRASGKGLSDVDVDNNPGIKLLDYYHDLIVDQETSKGADSATAAVSDDTGFATDAIRQRSPTMQSLEGVSTEWVEAWLAGLGF